MVRSKLLLAAALLGATALAGCTTADEQAALTGVNVACTALGVGSQIAVNVVTGGKAQVITQTIGQGISASCPLLISGVQAAISQITAEGQTATVTVVTTSPKGVRRSTSFRARKVDGVMTYVVGPSPLAFLGL